MHYVVYSTCLRGQSYLAKSERSIVVSIMYIYRLMCAWNNSCEIHC